MGGFIFGCWFFCLVFFNQKSTPFFLRKSLICKSLIACQRFCHWHSCHKGTTTHLLPFSPVCDPCVFILYFNLFEQKDNRFEGADFWLRAKKQCAYFVCRGPIYSSCPHCLVDTRKGAHNKTPHPIISLTFLLPKRPIYKCTRIKFNTRFQASLIQDGWLSTFSFLSFSFNSRRFPGDLWFAGGEGRSLGWGFRCKPAPLHPETLILVTP